MKQVLRYANRQHGDWSMIQQAEVDVSLVKPDYIIEGKVDLIRGEGDTVEIVDFKSQRKPDIMKDREQLERYRRQLHIYAHLVEERTGKKVSRMHIYYTGEDSGVPTITFPYTKSAVEGTMVVFDDTVKRIMKKDFHHCANDPKVSADVAVKQPITGTKMTQEEADAEKRKVLYHWLGMLSSLKKLHDAGELDINSTLSQLTDPAMLEHVNGFLSENPSLLETDKYIVLHDLLGRDLFEERQLVPIRAAEITTIAAKYGYDARNDKMEGKHNG